MNNSATSSGSSIPPLYRPLCRYHVIVGIVLGLYALFCVALMIWVYRDRQTDPVFHWSIRMYVLWPLGAVLLPWALVETARYLARRSFHATQRLATWGIAAMYVILVLTLAWWGRDVLRIYDSNVYEGRYMESIPERTIIEYYYQPQTSLINAASRRPAAGVDWDFRRDGEYLYGYYNIPEVTNVALVFRGRVSQLMQDDRMRTAAWSDDEVRREYNIHTYAQWWRPVVEGGVAIAYLALVLFLAAPWICHGPHKQRLARTAALVVVSAALLAAIPLTLGYRFTVDDIRFVRGALADYWLEPLFTPHRYMTVADILVPVLAGYLGWAALMDRFLLYVREARRPIGAWELDGD